MKACERCQWHDDRGICRFGDNQGNYPCGRELLPELNAAIDTLRNFCEHRVCSNCIMSELCNNLENDSAPEQWHEIIAIPFR